MSAIWSTFVQWFADIIQFMYILTVNLGIPNYGLAIIFMTIAIKLVMFPLTQKQLESMRSMQKIQPRVKQLQEIYKDDQQKLQTKTMELYKEQGVNPFSSCLPLLIQMPIFIAFYRSLYSFNFTVAEHAKFLWIPNVGSPDPYYILAVLAAGTTFLQQRISMVDVNDSTQKTMLYMMPVFMGWIAATMPAGLPLYWIMFNILGILQQLYVNHREKVKMADEAQTKSNIKEREVKIESPASQDEAEADREEDDLDQDQEEDKIDQKEETINLGEREGNKHNGKRRKKRKKPR